MGSATRPDSPTATGHGEVLLRSHDGITSRSDRSRPARSPVSKDPHGQDGRGRHEKDDPADGEDRRPRRDGADHDRGGPEQSDDQRREGQGARGFPGHDVPRPSRPPAGRHGRTACRISASTLVPVSATPATSTGSEYAMKGRMAMTAAPTRPSSVRDPVVESHLHPRRGVQVGRRCHPAPSGPSCPRRRRDKRRYPPPRMVLISMPRQRRRTPKRFDAGWRCLAWCGQVGSSSAAHTPAAAMIFASLDRSLVHLRSGTSVHVEEGCAGAGRDAPDHSRTTVGRPGSAGGQRPAAREPDVPRLPRRSSSAPRLVRGRRGGEGSVRRAGDTTGASTLHHGHHCPREPGGQHRYGDAPVGFPI